MAMHLDGSLVDAKVLTRHFEGMSGARMPVQDLCGNVNGSSRPVVISAVDSSFFFVFVQALSISRAVCSVIKEID
jgi:hypothetical protein